MKCTVAWWISATTIILLTFLSFPQRVVLVRSCSTASSSRRQPHYTTTCALYSRVLCGRSAYARTAKRKTQDAWRTANGARASARKPNDSWVAWSPERTRRWHSDRSPSPVMTSLYSERERLIPFHLGGHQDQKLCVFDRTVNDRFKLYSLYIVKQPSQCL